MMLHDTTAVCLSSSRLLRYVFLFGALLMMIHGPFASVASADNVRTRQLTLDGSLADFGSGPHLNGRPSNNANIFWDYQPSAAGTLVATAMINGTLYWNSPAGGFTSLNITYKSNTGAVLNQQSFSVQGVGGDPNLAANQTLVNTGFTHTSLTSIEIAVYSRRFTLQGLKFDLLASGTDAAPLQKTVRDKIDNGTADFGSGSHSLGKPNGNGTIFFERVFSSSGISFMRASVTGTLYRDSCFQSGTSILQVFFRDRSGNNLNLQSVQESAGGGDCNANTTNQSEPVFAQYTDGRLWQVQLLAGANEVISKTRLYVFNDTTVGTIDLPNIAQVRARTRYIYPFTWTVPAPSNWHDLQSLRLTFRDEKDDVALSLLFDEETQSIALLDARTGEPGPLYPVGSRVRLETKDALVDLAQSRVVGSGPLGPSVTLNLALEFKKRAVRGSYIVEAEAIADNGLSDSSNVVGPFVVTK